MKEKKIKAHRFTNRIFSLFILFGIVFLLFLRVYQVYKVDMLMKDLHVLEQQKKKLLSDTEKAQAQVDRLKNIDRISKIVTEKYEMVSNTDKIVSLDLKGMDNLDQIRKEFVKRQYSDNKNIKLAGVH